VLAKEFGKMTESLMRMLSATGSPRLSSLAELVDSLFEYEGLALPASDWRFDLDQRGEVTQLLHGDAPR
jgi:hypothetical protein